MRGSKHTPRNRLYVLERSHGLAEIVERGGGVLAATVRLRRVSSAWSRALLKRMASLKGRVDQLTSEKRTLKGIKRTAHAIYESYYSDDLDFANY